MHDERMTEGAHLKIPATHATHATEPTKQHQGYEGGWFRRFCSPRVVTPKAPEPRAAWIPRGTAELQQLARKSGPT
jgi:hypothetical protein